MAEVKKGFKLESIGKVAAAGWGDKVLMGFLLGLLDRITPQRVYEYIQDDKALLYWASESQWQHFRRMAKAAKVENITTEQIIEELREHRPDLLGLIINHPRGMEWFNNQIAELKKKLEK